MEDHRRICTTRCCQFYFYSFVLLLLLLLLLYVASERLCSMNDCYLYVASERLCSMNDFRKEKKYYVCLLARNYSKSFVLRSQCLIVTNI